MLPLQVSVSHRDRVSIAPNLPTAKKPQDTLLLNPEARVAAGLVPRRFMNSPSGLPGLSMQWLLGLESSPGAGPVLLVPTGTAAASER